MTNVQYSKNRLGFDFNDYQRHQILSIAIAPNRVMNYNNNYQFAITYELERTLYEMVKNEFTVIKFLSNMGGLSSFLLSIGIISSFLDSPQVYIASDFVEEDSELSRQVVSKANVQQGCCTNFRARLVAQKRLPNRCRMCISGPKDRILAGAFKTGLREEMSISRLIRHIRVTEGVLKEKFSFNEMEWKEIYTKYSKTPISRVNNLVMLSLTKAIIDKVQQPSVPSLDEANRSNSENESEKTSSSQQRLSRIKNLFKSNKNVKIDFQGSENEQPKDDQVSSVIRSSMDLTQDREAQ